MSFRERLAWINLLSIAVCYGVYFAAMLRGRDTFHLFVACLAALAVIQVALKIVATVRNPLEAKAPRDERERLIDGKARTLGYYVLVVGVLTVGIPGHTGGSVIDVLNHAMLAIVVAELSVSLAQIVLHRRGA
jgi:hypothetical protein